MFWHVPKHAHYIVLISTTSATPDFNPSTFQPNGCLDTDKRCFDLNFVWMHIKRKMIKKKIKKNMFFLLMFVEEKMRKNNYI